jgi:2-polyprenyl-3-methyl-5-hydroxy-6-metoxy-1,4-benzoquinol methylase
MTATHAVLFRLARAVERLHGLLVYMSVAALSLPALRATQAVYWSDFAFSDDDIDRGWFTWERDVAARHVRPGMRVLLIGCGTGRDLIGLLRAGCRVTGVDMAEAPLRRAREALDRRGLDARLIHGWIEDLPLDEQYDVIWFSWLSYTCIPMAARRVEMLRRLSTYLRSGGVIVVNVLVESLRLRAIAPARWVGRACRSGWLLEPGDVVIRMAGEGHYQYQHLFEPAEAERELAAAGLAVIDALHDATALVAAPVAGAVADVRTSVSLATP